jgi:hypothetical protein
MEQQKSPYIRDIKLPPSADKPTDATVPEPQTDPELINNVPVKMQESAEQANNPIASQQSILAVQPTEADQEFDQILKDVNHEVKEQSSESADKKSRLGFKKKEQVHSGPQAAKNHYLLPITVAVIVSLALVFVAFLAFKKSTGV